MCHGWKSKEALPQKFLEELLFFKKRSYSPKVETEQQIYSLNFPSHWVHWLLTQVSEKSFTGRKIPLEERPEDARVS